MLIHATSKSKSAKKNAEKDAGINACTLLFLRC